MASMIMYGTEGVEWVFDITNITTRTREEIQTLICNLFLKAQELQTGCRITIDGYNDDPRELWQIPEVVTFLKMWADEGGMSVMEVIPPEFMNLPKGLLPGFTAIEVWLIVKGYKVTVGSFVSDEQKRQFLADLMASNVVVRNLIAIFNARYEQQNDRMPF